MLEFFFLQKMKQKVGKNHNAVNYKCVIKTKVFYIGRLFDIKFPKLVKR